MAGAFRHTIVVVGATLVALSAIATPAAAKGAAITMVYGKPLLRPAFIRGALENERLAFAVADDTSVLHAHLTGRPWLRVAMFWGVEWTRYAQRHNSLAGLRSSQANQFARFYPAYGTDPAFFVFDSIPGPYTSLIRRIDRRGLAILARHGVPIRLPMREGSSYEPPLAALGALRLQAAGIAGRCPCAIQPPLPLLVGPAETQVLTPA